MLPSPEKVVRAFIGDFPLLMHHLSQTLFEAGIGLILSIITAIFLALVMDLNNFLERSLMPLLVLTQTMPTIALAPLLVLWFGYGASPKIALVFLTCFFPMTLSIFGGFKGTDPEATQLLHAMGASRWQMYRYIKIPTAVPAFFSGLKVSSSYSIIGAVVAEWLGGNAGLGVYMTRVRKSYSFDKMFAVIVLVAVISLCIMKIVERAEKIILRKMGK
ncbi:nitrate ABC transporter permease [Spirochaetia bacterium]|nr:nitrate ABC transporter permease [Spirochaetia bacterium]